MTEAARLMADGDLGFLADADLVAFLERQRWFGGKSEPLAHARVVDASPLGDGEPPLIAALVEARYQSGVHDLYQMLLGMREADGDLGPGGVAQVDGLEVYEALSEPDNASRLVRLTRAEAAVATPEGVIEFHTTDWGASLPDAPGTARLLGMEQSNTSVVVDDLVIIKAFRRLEPGCNPELELLRFLSERGFQNTPALAGWYDYSGRTLDATLGIAQRFVAGASDGWKLAVAALVAGDAESFTSRLRRLGEVTGQMHAVFGSDADDPAFAPEQPSTESLGILTATIDEEVIEAFAALSGPAVEPIVGRREEVRDRLRALTSWGVTGKIIRQHGDYHLGQVLWDGDDWVIIDFEGEPARHLSERRRKRSPLRDVAGMLRSFDYAQRAAVFIARADPDPTFSERGRDEFLSGYLPVMEPTGLLPSSRATVDELIAIFELEKAVYDLRYELDHRPDWVPIAVEAMLGVLDSPLP
jgi:trehalose synthase-fused probable maltokinase